MKFRRLVELGKGDITFSMILVRATKALLEINSEGVKSLIVTIDENSELITNSAEDQAHFKSFSPDWFQERINLGKTTEIADFEHPLRVLTADLCLVLVIDGKEYILSHYREIPLKGWILPGDHPESIEELFYPKSLAVRETKEEVVIADVQGNVYSYGLPGKELEANIKKWKLEPKEIINMAVFFIFVVK